MSTFDSVMNFRSLKEPLLAMWRVGRESAYGSLLWEGAKPILHLAVEVKLEDRLNLEHSNLPILRVTAPPSQPSITAWTQGFGLITLEACARYNVRTIGNFAIKKSLIVLSFLPTRIWIGSFEEETEHNVSHAIAYDTRLVGFFRTPGMVTHMMYSPEKEDVFASLGNPSEIWTFDVDSCPRIAIADTGFELQLGSSVSHGYSATSGYSARSVTSLAIHSEKPRHLRAFEEVIWKIQRLLSVFALERFAFQAPTYHSEQGDAVALAWSLGDERDRYRPPMHHQILLDFSDHEGLAEILNGWFEADASTELSRWLFCRALEEADDGVARFITVAQAFEVLGRRLKADGKLAKSELQEAVECIRVALSGQFEPEFVERAANLILSSNKRSFRDTLNRLIKEAIEGLDTYGSADVSEFCKAVSDTRNTLVHMVDNDRGKLEEAFSRVNKLSLRLCFWYAVVQAHQIRVPASEIENFLINNRNARHGLPNEFLEPL